MNQKEVDEHFIRNKKQLPKTLSKIGPGDVTTLSNIHTILETRLNEEQLDILKQIGLSIGTSGMTLDDSCLLARITRDELDELSFRVPEVKIYLRLKQAEYKQKLLSVISNQAVQNGDVKMAMWLLEKHYAEEYDSSIKKDLARSSRDTDGDMLAVAFAMVRRKTSDEVPVNTQSGNAEDRKETKTYDISEILS